MPYIPTHRGLYFCLTHGCTRKVITPPWYRGGVDGPLPLMFLICCNVSKRFYLQWKAFDFLYKMRYILWVVALLGVCDVTKQVAILDFIRN